MIWRKLFEYFIHAGTLLTLSVVQFFYCKNLKFQLFFKIIYLLSRNGNRDSARFLNWN